MRNFGIVLALLLLLLGCSSLSRIPDSVPLPTDDPASVPAPTLPPTPGLWDSIMLTDAQETVDNVKALCCEDGWVDHLFDAESKSRAAQSNGQELDIGEAFLENLEAAGERFDASGYFTALPHLSPEAGYVLDYVYYAPDEGFGGPYLYTRREGEAAFANYSAYKKAGGENYLSHIQVDGTAQGYYELAVLSAMGGQFYLAWHATYYDKEVVSSRERLEAIIELLNERYRPLTEEQAEAVLQLDFAPIVKFKWGKVQVRVLLFTKFGGFYERVYTINRNFPHQMTTHDVELIPYNCGVVY